ncbi:hypothetical protein [Aquamicrobium sp.]|uniref:hypothetical protein n=1 Tax=Aquamicrobium sp. TaxID=1872579 RepID=UPI00258662B1|nr:hypothetical protein [Aquamicrobium sp.]MCK9553934.1 hypothetical protein [Aquamicrobium sp.]
MTPLVRFLLRHAIIGCIIAVSFLSAMLAFDLAGLRTLATGSSSGPFAIALLAFACSLTFASVQMGFAVMLLGKGPESGGGKRRHVQSSAKPLQLRPSPARTD